MHLILAAFVYGLLAVAVAGGGLIVLMVYGLRETVLDDDELDDDEAAQGLNVDGPPPGTASRPHD